MQESEPLEDMDNSLLEISLDGSTVSDEDSGELALSMGFPISVLAGNKN